MPPFSSVHLPMFTFRYTVFSAAQRSFANQPGRVALSLRGAYCSLSMPSTLACPSFCVKLLYHGNSAFEPNVCLSRMAVTALELQQLRTPTCCTHPDCHRRFLPMFYPQQALHPSDLGSRFVLTMLADAAARQSRTAGSLSTFSPALCRSTHRKRRAPYR